MMEDNELSPSITSPANSLCSTLDLENGKDKIRDLAYDPNFQVLQSFMYSQNGFYSIYQEYH